ncbi:MAG: M20/M25/M40 family metallo-hydrolase [Verrucomicrobia bacterium]|nr:M20/M25/M40 family metallo-hydrolase [Verrucomicrobiota bacterium]
MLDTAALKEFLQQQLPANLELLKSMVEINSFTTNKDGVSRLGKMTAEAFAPFGFNADFVPSLHPDYGDHLVMTRKGTGTKVIGLISHLDTVFPPEEEIKNNFQWRVAGDKIYGPGTEDIKGGTTMIHLVLTALQKFAPDVFEEITWVILLNSSEEVMSHDFGKLCIERLGADALAALVFEAGARTGNAFSLVTARKGRAVYRISVEGRAAHAGSHHERGANAIVQLSETIQKVAALTDYSKQLTFNVATVTGGTVINRVPHFATAEGELRTFEREIYNCGIEKLLALSGKGSVCSAEDGHPSEVKIEVTQESPPWPRNNGTDRLFSIFSEVSSELGLRVVREERGGISDGNFICHVMPVLDGLGPNGDNGHCSEQSADGSKEQEYIDVTSIIPKAALNTLAILRLAQSA